MHHTARILLVSDTVFDSNGVSRFIQDMADNACRRGVDFSVLTASPLGESRANIVNLAPRWAVRMPFYKEQYLCLIPPAIRIWAHIRRRRPDVIHLSTPGPLGMTALLIAKTLRIPIVATYHTDFPEYLRHQTGSVLLGRVTAFVMRRFYHRMAVVVSRSQRYLGVLHRQLGIDPGRTVYLPAGTDTRRFHPRHRDASVWERFDLEGESLKVLYVGRLSAEKNFDFILKVFERYRIRYGGDVDFVVVGEGEALKRREHYAQERIWLLGRQGGETLSALYASSDVFAFASTTETLGQVVMEACASALPCLVSNEGGVVESVENGVNGYCLAVSDVDAWVRALHELVCEPELRHRMGRQGHLMMADRSITQSFEAFVEVHDQTVKESRKCAKFSNVFAAETGAEKSLG